MPTVALGQKLARDWAAVKGAGNTGVRGLSMEEVLSCRSAKPAHRRFAICAGGDCRPLWHDCFMTVQEQCHDSSLLNLGKASTSMDSVESIVMGFEVELLQHATRSNARRLDALLADDFLEVGANGQSFGKLEVLSRLPHENGVDFIATSMQAHVIAETVMLVTYRAERRQLDCTSHSRRSSLWVRNDAGWRMRYHQGTGSDPLEAARQARSACSDGSC